MWNVLLSFVKNKLFTLNFGFLSIFIIIFGVIAYKGFDSILERLGFETKAKLKEELALTKQQLENVINTNLELNYQIQKLQEEFERNQRVLEELQKERENLSAKVEELNKTLTLKNERLSQVVKKKVRETETELVIPKEEVQKLSQNNIEALLNSYGTFFSNEGEKK